MMACVVGACWSSSVHAVPVGTVFSGTTAADAASPYWNSAAMTLIKGTRISLGIAVSAIHVQYQRDTPSALTGEFYPEASFSIGSPDPMLGVVTDFGLEDFRFGLSVAIPWADGAGWAETYQGKPSSTRYHGLSPRIGQLMIGPVMAYRINRYVSVGIGLDIAALLVHHEFMVDFGGKINQVLCAQLGTTTCMANAPIAREDPAYSGRVELTGFGWDVGLSAGVLVTPLPWLRIGLGVHGNAGTMTIPANITVQVPVAASEFVRQNLPTVALDPISGEGDLDYRTPVIVTAGIGVIPTERLEFALDLHWMNLSSTAVILGAVRRSNSTLLDEIVTVKGRYNQYVWTLRGAYRLLSDLVVGGRVEFATNTRPEEFVTPTSPDMYKLSLHLGLSWELTRFFAVTAEYAHYFAFSREIKVSRFGFNPFPTTGLEQSFDTTSPTGRYSAQADRFAMGVRFSF